MTKKNSKFGKIHKKKRKKERKKEKEKKERKREERKGNHERKDEHDLFLIADSLLFILFRSSSFLLSSLLPLPSFPLTLSPLSFSFLFPFSLFF